MGQEKVLITGAAGFIGSALAKRLVGRYHIIGIDRVPFTNCAEVIISPLQGLELEHLLTPDTTVFHFAAPNDVAECERDPDGTIRDSVLGAELVFCAAQRAGARVVFPTTAANTDQRSLTAYATAKTCCEKLAAMWRAHGLRIVVLRYFNVYGPGQRASAIIPKLVGRAVAGVPAVIYDDDHVNLRSFVHIDDVNDFHETLLRTERWEREEYTLYSPDTISVSQLAYLVADLAKGPEPSRSTQSAPGGTSYPQFGRYTLPDGWKRNVSLTDGLKSLIALERERQQRAVETSA